MTPLRAVLRVVKLLPHEHVTVVVPYAGWMSGFTGPPRAVRSPGRPSARRRRARTAHRTTRAGTGTVPLASVPDAETILGALAFPRLVAQGDRKRGGPERIPPAGTRPRGPRPPRPAGSSHRACAGSPGSASGSSRPTPRVPRLSPRPNPPP